MKNIGKKSLSEGHRYTQKEVLSELEGYAIEAKSTRAERVNGSRKNIYLLRNLKYTQKDITALLGVAKEFKLSEKNPIIKRARSQLHYP